MYYTPIEYPQAFLLFNFGKYLTTHEMNVPRFFYLLLNRQNKAE